MLQRLREALTTFLLLVLPLHALIVTAGTKWLRGPGHAPLSSLVLWKEVLIAIVLMIAVYEVCDGLRNQARRRHILQFDAIDACIVALLTLCVVVSALTHGDPLYFLFGFKYVGMPLVAFFVLRRVVWSDRFAASMERWLLVLGALLATYGIVTLLLPMPFFVWLGYSDLHSLYRTDGPLAAFQQIGGSSLRRLQSTMSGPNQFGLWILIPLCVAIVNWCRCHWSQPSFMERLVQKIRPDSRWCAPLIYSVPIVVALGLSFSRSGWLAAIVIVIVALWRQHPDRKRRRRMLVRFGAVCIFLLSLAAMLNPTAIIRLGSTRGHLEQPIRAFEKMINAPLGAGLGMAGPAQSRFHDACVHLRPQDDPSWAADRPHLCVFLGEQQVQPLPSEKVCTCPFYPENWYLQIGIELGIAGFLIFIALMYLLFKALDRAKDQSLAEICLLILAGLCVASFVMHAWEDNAVAYTTWILIAVVLSRLRLEQKT